MDYFFAIVFSGLLSGAIYALVGAAFVVVYRASAVLNLSLGDWVMVGARVTGTGVQALGLPLAGAVATALAALTLLAVLFNRFVIRHLSGRPIIAVVMATLALGLLMRGGVALGLGGVPGEIPVPFGNQLWWWGDIALPPARLLASGLSLGLLLLVMAFFRWSRSGIAIRAIADDAQAAAAAGISATHYLSLTWAIAGALCVAGGVLWSIDGMGGFSMSLVLIKVLPVVVIGGLTSFAGVYLGSLIVGLSESLAAGYLDPLIGTGTGGLIAAVLVIVMLWLRPEGLFGARQVLRV